MWSEENGNYHIHAFIDQNNNGAVDAGEPAGTKEIRLSCEDDPHCEGLALDCLDGVSCFGFQDTPCDCNADVCGSEYHTCC